MVSGLSVTAGEIWAYGANRTLDNSLYVAGNLTLGARRDEAAQSRDARAFRSVGPADDPCRDNDSDRGHACEVRDSRLPAGSCARTRSC